VNYFDDSIINFLNGFSRASEVFDYFMALLISNHFVKGGILMTVLWWFWFRDKKETSEIKEIKGGKNKKDKQEKQVQRDTQNKQSNQLRRERLVLTLVACLFAIFLARFLAYILPFRLRPLHGMSNFITPYGVNPNALGSWSSFPSDHAVLFFTLATGMFFISRITGILVTIYIFLIICFPRVYCGLHYPTDIIAGALIGIGIGWLVVTTKINKYITQPAMLWLNREPGSFYACFFLLTYQIGTMFDPVREIGIFIMCLMKPL
jgi:undecaprenyl-diphosphatase